MSVEIRVEDRGISYLRRSGALRRRVKRQVPGSANLEVQLEEEDDGNSSDDEKEEASSQSSSPSAATRFKTRPMPPASSTFPISPPSQTETVISMISTSAVRQSNTLALVSDRIWALISITMANRRWANWVSSHIRNLLHHLTTPPSALANPFTHQKEIGCLDSHPRSWK